MFSTCLLHCSGCDTASYDVCYIGCQSISVHAGMLGLRCCQHYLYMKGVILGLECLVLHSVSDVVLKCAEAIMLQQSLLVELVGRV